MNNLYLRATLVFLSIWVSVLLTACDRNEEIGPPTNSPVPPANLPTTVETNSIVPTAEALSPQEAKNHVGEDATVRGKVFRVYVTQKGDVFIDIGGKHPDAPFTAVCFKQKIPTDQLQQLDGKTISVKGKIKEYQGKIEIVLETADQIIQETAGGAK